MDIVFSCAHCGQSLVADEAGKGLAIHCPACGKAVIIPEPVRSKPASAETVASKPMAPKKMVRIHSDKPAAESKAGAGEQPAAQPADPPRKPKAEAHLLEIVVGWICVIVGVLIEILLPRAVLVYVPFFIGSFAMGFILLVNGKALHGFVLLLCTCIPAPLLMKQNVWRNITSSARAPAASSGAQKLVFDERGQAKLVSAETPTLKRYAQVTAPSAPRKPRMLADEIKTKKPRAAQLAEAGGAPAAEQAGATSTERQPGHDPYRELLEGGAEIPPLVPEDELAATRLGREEGFRWQDDSSFAAILPGAPAPVAEMPFNIYTDAGEEHKTFWPGGRIGNEGALTIDEKWDVDPRFGKTCMRVSFTDPTDWVTAAWLHPPNNWGDFPGGHDLSKATKLTFWGKGDAGGEKAEFRVGMEQAVNAVSRDTLQASSGTIRFGTKWKKYSVPLEKYDRTRVISGFIIRVEGQNQPIIFYLDDIRFE